MTFRLFSVVIIGFVSFLLGHVNSLAQNVSDYTTIKAPSPWVDTRDIPDANPESGVERDFFYRLVDRQVRATEETTQRYFRFAMSLNTSTGVEDQSTLTVNFDPEYQTVTLHHINIIRDGEIIDKLDLTEFDIYRVETDREKLIYNGDLQLSYAVPGVRAGDTLDYAYTRIGRNPALGPHFYHSVQQKYNTVVVEHHNRVLIHQSLPITTKTFAKAEPFTRRDIGDFIELYWHGQNETPFSTDDDRPYWHYGFPIVEVSSFENWEQVGQYFAEYYATPSNLSPNMHKIVEDIQKSYDDPREQARAALDYVQKNIRYLGIELGSGGYIPRPPELTLERLYGDCKDMTVLLTTLLRALNIKADPMLVDFDRMDAIKNNVPTYAVFGHVVVRVQIDDTAYVLDPTRGEQLGDLEHLQQGYFGYGVVISETEPGLVEAVVPDPEFYEGFEETYDLTLEDHIRLDSVSTYYAFRADSMRSWYQEGGMSDVEKGFREFYESQFSNIEQIGDIKIESFIDQGKITFTAAYKIIDGWEEDPDDNIKTFTVLANETDSNIPDFEGVSRTTPYAVTHPNSSQYTLSFQVDDTWSFTEEDIDRSTDAFDYTKISTFKDNIYIEVYTYRSLDNHIAADDFVETMKVLDEIDDELGVVLQYPLEASGLDGMSDAQIGGLYVLGLIIAGLMSLAVVAHYQDGINARMHTQILYPVALWKLLLFSLISIGFYALYWFYRNWKWLRDVDGNELSPLIRSFFAPFTNFALFWDMTRKGTAEEVQGHSWYGWLAIPAALLYFLFEMSTRIADRIEAAPDWVSLLWFGTVLTLIPPGLQVLKLNHDRPEEIAQNSRLTWQSYAFLALFTPLFLVMLTGSVVILQESF